MGFCINKIILFSTSSRKLILNSKKLTKRQAKERHDHSIVFIAAQLFLYKLG